MRYILTRHRSCGILKERGSELFITLIDEKADTQKPGILVEITHDGTRGTVFVLDPETRTWSFEPRIPNGSDNAYIDDDGKHGVYFREGDPDDFPQPGEDSGSSNPPDGSPHPDDPDEENTEATY